MSADPPVAIGADGAMRVHVPALRRALRIWAGLALAAALALGFALSVGSSDIALADVLRLLVLPDGSAPAQVLHELRLPRALAAFAAGALLATAGLAMQVLLRNPLADPYVLGLSSGAAVGALGAMLLGLGVVFVEAGAMLGSLLTVGLLLLLARRDFGGGDANPVEASPRLLLTGVILASGWSALVTVILVLAPENRLRGMIFWLMGDLGGVDGWRAPLVALGLLLALLMPMTRDMNVLLRGDDIARSLGVDAAATRRRLMLAASLATAVAVTSAGAVGFVGLVVPHALRLAFGNDQRVLVPASMLAGGALLVLADTLARSAFAPQQLPVGALTALIGVPSFIALLSRRRP